LTLGGPTTNILSTLVKTVFFELLLMNTNILVDGGNFVGAKNVVFKNVDPIPHNLYKRERLAKIIYVDK